MTDIRKPFEPGLRVQFACSGVSRVKQQFKNECDVNLILKKYGRNGQVPQFSSERPFYGDFSNVEDYHTALDVVMASRASFDRLPAALRGRFDNDPAKLLAFVENPSNFEEGVKLGIFKPNVVVNKTEEQSSAQVPT